jgi:hypothetical protein
MHCKINVFMMVVVVSWLIIAAAGCASSPAAPLASPAQPAVLRLQQPGMTDYMRSRVGTPEELSPLAPAEARNVRKVGDHWICEINGQTLVFDGATWVPQSK